MASAPTPTQKGGPITWDKLPESAKNEFFTGDISNDGYLRGLIQKHHLVGISLEEIRFQQYVDASLAEKDREPQESHEAEAHAKHSAPHAASHGHGTHTFKPDTLTKQISDTKEYTDMLTPLQQERAENWEKKKAAVIAKWENSHGKNIDSPEGNEYLNSREDNPNSHAVKKLAEKQFREKHPDLARKADENVSAGSYENDEIGKQYKAAARQNAQAELESRYGKKMRNKTMSPEAYRAKANEIYARHDKEFAKQFTRDYKVKAQHYIQRGTDPVLNRAYSETRQGKKQAAYTQRLAKATMQGKKAIAALPAGTLTDKNFRRQLNNKLNAKEKERKPAKEYGNKRHELDIQAVKDHEAIYGPIDSNQKQKRPSLRSIQNLFKKLQEQESGFSAGENFEPQQLGEEPLDLSDLDANSVEGSLAEAPGEAVGEGAMAPAAEGAAAGEAAGAGAAAGAGGAAAGGVAAAGGATAAGGAAAAATFPVWGIVALVLIGILLLLLIIMIILNVINNNIAANANANANNIPGFTMTIDGPDNVPNGTTNKLTYTINITYTLFDTIQITNPIPTGAVCAPGTGYTCNGNNDIVWNLDSVKPTQTNGDTKIYQIPVSFTVPATTRDTNIVEAVTADDLTTGAGNTPVPGLTLTVKTVPGNVANGEIFDYVIDATYTGSDKTVQIFANVPPHTQLLGQPTGPKVTNVNGLITWVLSDYGNKAEFLYRVKPDTTLNDTVLTNTVYATSRGTGASTDNIIWLNSASDGEFGHHTDWISGQCSQASLAEILNAYKMKTVLVPNSGDYYTIVEVATISQGLGIWDNYFHSSPTAPSLHDAWNLEASQFHMNIDYQDNLTPTDSDLQKVIDIANGGHPVIVTAPNHYLVVWGGDSKDVWTLDSSGNNETWAPNSTLDSVTIDRTPFHNKEVTRALFLKGLAGFANYWGGGPNGEYTGNATAIILTPK